MITNVTKLHNLGSIQSFFSLGQKVLVIIVIPVIYCNCKGKNLFLDSDLRDYDISSIK